MEDELDLIIQNMVSAGESEDNIALVINSYNSEKKKSTPTSTPQKSVSGTPTGSSGGVNPAFKNTAPSPIPDFNSVWKEKKPVEKPKTFRLPNESDEVEMQRRGITPPPSEMLKQTANNTKELYDLDANGNVIPEKPNKLFAGLKKQDKTKGFYQQGEELVKQNKDIQNGFSEKTTFELEGGKLIPKTTVKDFKTSEGIDKEIENNDLNLDHPYLYYSTFDKENQPKDTFVESNFGENKLADLGINTADFDGFLNKKGYKAEFLEKEANGLFEGKGADLTGGYNIQLAKEIQKQRLLNLYMQDINSRDFAKRKLNQEKVNLGKLRADREQLNTQYTLFDANKVGAFYEKEMPILTQKLKERDVENKKIYDTHKNGDAGFFYGTKQVLNSGWNGFIDRVNQTSTTMLDKIGLDSGADELRLLNEERQVQRPNTRDVGYASGRTTTYDGVDYLVTNDGQIIDKDKKIRVTDLFFKPTYDAIVNKSKSGAEDFVFSFQGSAIQAGGVLGDMIVQVALQRGVGLASGATVKAGSLLSKIPISKSIGSAIIAQSALGYSQGLEQTYKAAIDAGIDEKTAKVLATDAAQRMAGLYAVTAPISPQTKAIEGIFGSEGKELIKKAIAAYTQTGKKGFIETFKQGGKQLSKNAIIFTEEGGKEVFQENTQQGGESYGVNASINREIGRELLKETISGDEFVNTSILTFASGGLMTLPGMFSSTDKLKTLQQLSKNPLEFEKNLKELVSKGVFTNDKADVLRKDVKIYSNQSHKIPKNLNKDIAMDVMSDLEDISQLEVKKKGIDKSFHEEIDAEIEAKRTGIRDRINFIGLSKKEIATLKETASDELIVEAKEQGKKEFKFDNKQITERANKIYAKQVKENKKKENEQTPPTPEAQPQAEVPQQAEAEKVETSEVAKKPTIVVHGAVNGFGLQYSEGIDEKDIVTPQDARGFSSQEDQVSLNKGNSVVQEDTVLDNGDKKISILTPSMDSSGRASVNNFEFTIPTNNASTTKGIQSVLDDVRNGDLSGKELIDETVKQVKKYIDSNEIIKTKRTPKPQEVSPVEDVVAKSISKEEYADFVDNNNVSDERLNSIAEKVKNQEKLSEQENAIFVGKTSEINKIIADAGKENGDITPDGNVRPTATNVGESGNAKPKSNSKSSIPSSVDGGEVKGDVEVGKIKPNIGDKVDFGEGEEVITGFAEIQGQTFIKSKPIEGNMVNRESLNPLSEYNDVLSKQEEYFKRAEENKKAQKEREIEAENKAKKQQEKQNEFEDIDGFANDKTAIQKGKILQHLNKQVYRGTIKSELRRIANLPHRFIERDGKKRVIYTEENGTEFLLSDVYTTKTGLEYLQYLVDKNAKTVETAQVENKQKPTTKERIAERIKLSDAKVDNIKDAINGIDSIFGIKIKVDDIEGLNKNGIDIVEVIANIAKQAIAAGIHIDEAINKTIEHLKKTIDFDVNIDEIKERINPKKEADKADKDFKSKSGKKSLLGRLIEGGNPDVITKAVKELGENYDVRNQQEANDEAMAFIDKVGASEALKAIKDGLITNSDVKMLIYDEALTRLKTEISDEMNNNPEDREALIKKFQEVSDDFDKTIRDAGQGIAIMNFIYNKNQTLKYNLKKQIADWKRNDPNNEIPDDIKAKYEELDQKLKDLEEKTKDAEIRAKKAEDELAVKNIQEDVAREKKAAKTNKTKAKELANIIRTAKIHRPGIFSSATPASLAWDGAVEVVAKSVEAGGTIADAIENGLKYIKNTNWYKGLSDTDKQEAEDTFKSDLSKSSRPANITIGKDKKIKIPAQLLRDYVEQGYTDIDEIAALIKDDIADEFPDVDVRDIRDALTGYGKQINPNKDEITAQVNKLKEYGRLLSAYDDVMNGEMPKKSGLVRPKSEQKARELRRNINRLAKELNLEPVDLERQWANAVDKVKSHLKNQIEDLDKQIANGEKRKVERTSIKLDEEATALKAVRDAKKQILDDLVGKPELTEEQKIANAEKSLDNSIKKLQEEIDTNDIAFKEKPTAVNSKKIEELKAAKKALLETKKQLRQEAGLIEQQRLKTAKTRIKNQIEDLNTRIKNKDFAKKEVKPILADNELNTLRAEKEAVYEEYEKMKYLQELKNRTFAKKLMDEGLEALGLARAIKASLDLGLIGIQLRGFTYSELWRNPKELAHKFIKMFGAIGSQNKTNKAMSELIGHPLHALAKKLDIGMTHPDLRNEVREEMASGNLLHFIWSSPVLAIEALGGKEAMNSKRTSIGDSFIDSVKKQYNKLFQNYQVDIKQKEKFSVKEQWTNINAFEAVERGLSIYGNQLRFEEFVRGVDRLKAEGKDEINHLEDYKALASYIRTFSGRAKPAGFELNQKALNVFFFSFKNMASVIQQLNPIYYGLQHTRSTDFKNGNYFKPTVANKMAMATMFKSVVSTSATLLFVMAAYNAFKDDDEEEATIEKDPRSSDFGKLKIGNFRYDPWGGYIPLISLYARLATEEVKKSDGTISKFGEDRFGIQNRGDAASRFLINKESPGFQMFHKYMTSTEEVDKATGETYRATPFGGKLSEEDAYSFYPIFLGSVKSAKEKDYEGVQAFLTAYSILGLGNVQDYENKKANPEAEFLKDQEKKKSLYKLPENEKVKIRVNRKLTRVESDVKLLQNLQTAQQKGLPYFISMDAALTKQQVKDMDLSGTDESVARIKQIVSEVKAQYGIEDEE